MRALRPMLAAAILIQTACADPGGVVQPTSRAVPTARSDVRVAERNLRIDMLDACDPVTFNAALGAGTCVGAGKVTFTEFINRLTRTGTIGAWRFWPAAVQAKVGQTLVAVNLGGETHTFTEVDAFGGGIVPMLNVLSHNPVAAPECLALAPGDFVAPGGTDRDPITAKGTELYQCCIHPWMRTTVTATDN